jgi:hypothetical protein
MLNRATGTRRHLGVALVGLLVLLAALAATRLTSRSRAAPHARPVLATTTQRTANKTICASLKPAALPGGMAAKDRSLVPFSAAILGVDQIWESRDAARSIEVVDGGYVDDITEPYDGLTAAPSVALNGTRATVLTTIFLHRPVWLAYWRQAGVTTPCDVHAIVTLGLSAVEFNRVLRSLTPAP